MIVVEYFNCDVFHKITMTGLAVDNNDYKDLTDAEEMVIQYKGTEPPFSGSYNDFSEVGTYHCKRCDVSLYRSRDKFQSNCGWPSFDGEVLGAVKQQPDTDGFRTEIVCENCGAHLGHVFVGEHLTDKNIRHCVNSISLKFTAAAKPEQLQKAYFAGGCFWGVEFYFAQKSGVVSAISGYMGGSLKNPLYRDVTSGLSGHLEVVEVEYDANKVSYEDLAKFFFEIHDPTQANGQGPDIGSQYLSAIFYQTEDEKKVANKLIAILESMDYEISTKVLPSKVFWPAEDYHQDYYARKKQQPYCHAYEKKF